MNKEMSEEQFEARKERINGLAGMRNSDGWGMIYGEVYNLVLAHAKRKGALEPPEVVNEAFTRLYGIRDEIEPNNVLGLLLTTINHIVIDENRRRMVRKKHDAGSLDARTAVSRGGAREYIEPDGNRFGRSLSNPWERPPEDTLIRKMESGTTLRMIRKAQYHLTKGQRQVMAFDEEGYRNAQIAEVMGITEGAVKSQLHRARVSVGRSLVEDGLIYPRS